MRYGIVNWACIWGLLAFPVWSTAGCGGVAAPGAGGSGGSAAIGGSGGSGGFAGTGGSGGSGGSRAYLDEGSWESPLDITGLMPYDGQVSRDGDSAYRITGVMPDAIYTITLARRDGLAYPIVPNSAGGGSVACGWNDTTQGASIDCALRATSGGMLSFQASGDDSVGGAYVLTFAAGGVVNEGSPSNPVVVSSFPFSGGALLQSFYLLNGLTAGGAYAIEFVDASAAVALFIFPDDTYQRQPHICFSLNGSGNPCQVAADGSGQIYVLTDIQQELSMVTYTVSVTTADVANEGSRNAPIEIGSQLPYSGMVHTASSWYSVNGLTADAPYTITLSNATDDVRLSLYGPGWKASGGPRSDCQSSWANGGGNPIPCVSKADSSGEIRIEVRGFDTADGARFDLDSAPGGIPNEGYFGTPVDVTGMTPWSGTIYNGVSHYKMTGRAAATDYTVTIRNLTADLSLWVYDGGTFQNLLCTSTEPGTVDETCVVQTTTGELHMRVTIPLDVLGATFAVDVTP